MEPGHEDREYGELADAVHPDVAASMEPGHEDREYRQDTDVLWFRQGGLNGARS